MADDRWDKGTEGKLRRLFAALPRIGAPPGFEGSVRREIASQAAGGRRRFTTLAIPAFSMVVVAGVALIMYIAPFGGDEGGTGHPGSPSGETSPAATPEDSGPEIGKSGAPPAQPPAGKGEPRMEKPREGDRSDAEKADEFGSGRGNNLPRIMKSDQESPAGVTPSQAQPRQSPAVVPAEGSVADSIAPRDTAGADSSAHPTDSTSAAGDSVVVPPDSAGLPAPPPR